MLKKTLTKIAESKERKNWGKGTIVCTQEEFEKVFDEFKGQMVSPGGAAGALGVSRAYIHQLEKEGKIRAYRIAHDDIDWDRLPLWLKMMVAPRDVYIYIPDEDIERIKKGMIEKAETKLKKLKGK